MVLLLLVGGARCFGRSAAGEIRMAMGWLPTRNALMTRSFEGGKESCRAKCSELLTTRRAAVMQNNESCGKSEAGDQVINRVVVD